MGLRQVIGLWILGCWPMAGLWGQGVTERFDASIRLMDAHTAMVTATIAVAPDSGVTMLPLQAIKYEHATIDQVKIEGQLVDLIHYNHLWKIEHYGFAGTTVTLEYRVQWASDEVIIPMVYVPWKATDTEEGKMSVRISLPDQMFIGNHFPDVTFTKGTGDYGFDLPVVTSLVKFDLRTDEDFYVSGTSVVDGFIVLLLAGLGVLGWTRRKMLS